MYYLHSSSPLSSEAEWTTSEYASWTSGTDSLCQVRSFVCSRDATHFNWMRIGASMVAVPLLSFRKARHTLQFHTHFGCTSHYMTHPSPTYMWIDAEIWWKEIVKIVWNFLLIFPRIYRTAPAIGHLMFRCVATICLERAHRKWIDKPISATSKRMPHREEKSKLIMLLHEEKCNTNQKEEEEVKKSECRD